MTTGDSDTQTPVPVAGVFDASAAAAGYAMQIRYALYKAVEQLRTGIDWQISVEAGDDIEIEVAPGHTNYLQLKHRAEGTNLTDSSADLWKSMRIWCEHFSAGDIDLPTTQLILVTTSDVADDTIAARLSSNDEERDNKKALLALDQVAKESKNEKNAKAYASWLKLSEMDRLNLLARVTIVANSHNIDQVGRLLEAELALSVRRSQAAAFVARLEGWWFQRCINIFRSPYPEFIGGEEVDGFIADLRETFLPENLPIDGDIPGISVDVGAFDDYRFVHQAKLVTVSASRIGSAVRDYLRAYTQRSRWTRESLVIPDELLEYERRLKEEWQYVFDRCADELPEAAAEGLKTDAAKKIYQWVEEGAAPPIRRQCTERFLIRGSLHMLADRLESGVGWHPEFAARLIAILEPADV